MFTIDRKLFFVSRFRRIFFFDIHFMMFPTEKFALTEPQQAFFKRLFRKIFIEDWLMKLVALIITLALWLGVSGLRAPITTRLSNVVLQPRISNNMEITNTPVTEVALVVTGDSRKIDQIKPENLIVSFDLTDVEASDMIVHLTPENVNVDLPTGVRLEEIQPNKIAIKLETVEEREIPVKAELEGGLPENLEIFSQTVLPAKVRVRGPSSYIKSLDFVPTEKINLENQQSDFTAKQVSLNVSNPKATILDTAVDVVFRIGEKRIERIFLVPLKNEIADQKATVILYGPRSILENINPESLQVEMIKNETGNDSLQLNLPAEIQEQVEIRKLKIN
ncbi:MAG: DisA protein [Acidobacteria bacterium]|nr:DisA protein [Acidobacteriota bacterium]